MEVHYSVASLIEMAGKSIRGSIATDVLTARPALLASGFRELPITADVAAELERLPRHHLDPFDRMLVAHARIETLAILSPDEKLRRYDVEVIW